MKERWTISRWRERRWLTRAAAVERQGNHRPWLWDDHGSKPRLQNSGEQQTTPLKNTWLRKRPLNKELTNEGSGCGLSPLRSGDRPTSLNKCTWPIYLGKPTSFDNSSTTCKAMALKEDSRDSWFLYEGLYWSLQVCDLTGPLGSICILSELREDLEM